MLAPKHSTPVPASGLLPAWADKWSWRPPGAEVHPKCGGALRLTVWIATRAKDTARRGTGSAQMVEVRARGCPTVALGRLTGNAGNDMRARLPKIAVSVISAAK